MSTRSPAFIAAVLAAVVGASLLASDDYPHAFPRKGAKKLFENESVAIWHVEWPIGVAQAFHRHRYDMAGVYFRFGRIKVTRPDGTVNPPREAPYDIPRLLFQPKDVTHKEEGVGAPGDPAQEAVMTDLKGYSPVYGPPPAGVPLAFPRDGAKSEIDNERVHFWDYTWKPNTPGTMHFHDKDYVEVFVDGGTIRTKMASGKEETHTYKREDVRFVPGNRTDSEEATSGTPRAIIVELKPRS